MKRKTLTLAICFLALIAIVSVGFASWIITAPVKDQSKQGSITAEAVENKSYGISLEAVDDAIIHFGDPAASDPYKGGYGWFTSNGNSVEALNYEVKVKIDKYEYMAEQIYLNLYSIEKYDLETKVESPELDGKNEYVDILSQYKFDADKTDSKQVESVFYKAMQGKYIAKPQISLNSNEGIDYSPNFKLEKDKHFGLMVKVDGGTAEFKTVKEIKDLASTTTNIVAAEAGSTVSISGNVATITGNVYCSLTIEFNWGSFFSFSEDITHPTEKVDGVAKVMYKANTNLNPLIYYSFVEYKGDVANNAMAALNAIKAISDAKTQYKVEFSDVQK